MTGQCSHMNVSCALSSERHYCEHRDNKEPVALGAGGKNKPHYS